MIISIKEAWSKYKAGDALSDAEIVALESHFRNICELAVKIDMYGSVQYHAAITAASLRGMIEARKTWAQKIKEKRWM